MSGRATILFVRARRNPDSAPVLDAVVDEYVHALELHADVVCVQEDFDLAELGARIRPDFLLFDAIHWGRRHRVAIANAQAFPELPRALLLNSDPHDPMRPLTFAMARDYGIDTIFCTGHEDLEQTKELRRFHCFVLPKFVDGAVFRPYDEPRVIPVTVMSAHLAPHFYPWRAQVTEDIQRILPTLLYTHPGYAAGAETPFEIRDEAYARMLARSHFCVADTTRLDYAVRKHLEIPAAGAVLVAPPSAALADFGFVDMENCILGEAGPELYAKIRAVAASPARYEQIRQAGQALVHARYTRQAWTHVLDWYAVRRALPPGQVVQQDGVFGAFRPAPAGSPAIAGFAVRDNPMAARLRLAREALLFGGDLSEAARDLHEVMGWVGHAAEPWLLMGVLALAVGDLDNAGGWLAQRGAVQGADDPALGLLDPVEIAWLMLHAALTGDEAMLAGMQAAATATDHVALRRMQWLLAGTPAVADLAEAGLAGPLPGDCLSMHWLGDEDFGDWLGLVQRVLAAAERTQATRAA